MALERAVDRLAVLGHVLPRRVGRTRAGGDVVHAAAHLAASPAPFERALGARDVHAAHGTRGTYATRGARLGRLPDQHRIG